LELFRHTQHRTIVENSTFPSIGLLKGHDAWYFDGPGADGVANPNPEALSETPLLERLRDLAEGADVDEGLTWLDSMARLVVASVREAIEVPDAVDAQFSNDLQILERLSEAYKLPSSLHSYTQLMLFTIRYDVSWLIVTK
jgi:hypothetical protein